jgi:hypothetical protein
MIINSITPENTLRQSGFYPVVCDKIKDEKHEGTEVRVRRVKELRVLWSLLTPKLLDSNTH